jgi:hypothetical protein
MLYVVGDPKQSYFLASEMASKPHFTVCLCTESGKKLGENPAEV